jgi:D-3-phosphoglycerate dehydrogenase
MSRFTFASRQLRPCARERGSFLAQRLNFRPEGFHIMIRNLDKPGMVGKIGSILGEAGANIAGMYLGREFRQGTAVMALSLDGPVSDATMAEIRGVEGTISARLVEL